jgi:hypothetical protein
VLDVSVTRPDADGHCRFELKVEGTSAAAGVARGGHDG